MSIALIPMKLVFYIIILILATSCTKKDAWVVLYRHEVAKGNSIVWFANFSDETGYWAKEHCLKLAEIYTKEDSIDYFCSTKVFDKYEPKVN